MLCLKLIGPLQSGSGARAGRLQVRLVCECVPRRHCRLPAAVCVAFRQDLMVGGYPARHGIPHGTVSHQARFIALLEDVWHVVCCMDGVLSRHHEILPKHTTMHATHNDACNIQREAHKRSRVRTRSLGLACACGVWAHPCPPLPHLHRDWAPTLVCTGTGRYASGICIIVMCAAFFPAQRLQFNALIAENVVHRSSMAGAAQYTRVLLRASCPTCCPLAPSLLHPRPAHTRVHCCNRSGAVPV